MDQPVRKSVETAGGAQGALIALAEGLDVLIARVAALEGAVGALILRSVPADPWSLSPVEEGEWVPSSQLPEDGHGQLGEPVVLPEFQQAPELKRVSDEKMDRRRMFERQQLKLGDAFGPEGEGTDWTEIYAKGGPIWLYTNRRDIVMSYPDAARRMMIADVEEDDPQVAYDMALDMLKQPASAPDLETGAGAMAVGTVDGRSLKR